MPVHDWTRVEAGIFHDFHLSWIDDIKKTLNDELLPSGYYALAEQIAGRLGPDVLTLKHQQQPPSTNGKNSGGVALKSAPPKVRFRESNQERQYAQKARRISIRHVSDHQIVAIVEIVSPGNKSSRKALASFVRKAHEALHQGIHLLIVDVFPASNLHAKGLHPLIWDDPALTFKYSKKLPLVCASYVGEPNDEAFVEPFALGDKLPSMPLFLTPDEYVSVPLEKTYQRAWLGVPRYWRDEIVRLSR